MLADTIDAGIKYGGAADPLQTILLKTSVAIADFGTLELRNYTVAKSDDEKTELRQLTSDSKSN